MEVFWSTVKTWPQILPHTQTHTPSTYTHLSWKADFSSEVDDTHLRSWTLLLSLLWTVQTQPEVLLRESMCVRGYTKICTSSERMCLGGVGWEGVERCGRKRRKRRRREGCRRKEGEDEPSCLAWPCTYLNQTWVGTGNAFLPAGHRGQHVGVVWTRVCQ